MSEVYQKSGDELSFSGNNDSSLAVTGPNLDHMDDLDDFLAEQVEDSLEVAPEEMSVSPIQYSSWEIYKNGSEFNDVLEDDYIDPAYLENVKLLNKETLSEDIEALLYSINADLDQINWNQTDEFKGNWNGMIKKLGKLLVYPPLKGQHFSKFKTLSKKIENDIPGLAIVSNQVLMKAFIHSNSDIQAVKNFEVYLKKMHPSDLKQFFLSIYERSESQREPGIRVATLRLAKHMAIENNQPDPSIRKMAIGFLKKNPSQRSAAVLLEVATNDSNPQIRTSAITALASQPALIDSSGVDKINSFLIELLGQSISADLEYEVVITLSQRPGQEVAQALLDYFDKNVSTEDEDVEYNSFACLSRREGRAVEQRLLDHLNAKVKKGDSSSLIDFLEMVRIHADVDDADNLWLKNEIHTLHKQAIKSGKSSETVRVLEDCLKKWPSMGSLESKLIRKIEQQGMNQIEQSLRGLQQWQAQFPDCKTLEDYYDPNLPYEALDQHITLSVNVEWALLGIENTLRYLEHNGKTPWAIASLQQLKAKIKKNPILKNLGKTVSNTPPLGILEKDDPLANGHRWLLGKFSNGIEGRIQAVLDSWGVGQVKMDRMIPNLKNF